MLLEYNEKSVLWGAIIGLFLMLAFAIGMYNQPEVPFGSYFFILPIMFAISIFHLLNSNRKTGKLFEILYANKSNLSDAEIYFEGERIYPDTIVVQFQIIISIVFACFTVKTKPHLYRGRRPWANGIGYSALSLVLGPWSRKGLVVTPIAIYSNLMLPKQNTVEDLCLRLEAWGKPVKISLSE